MHSFHSQYFLRGICVSRGNYFRGKFYGEGANFPRGQMSGEQLSRGQFSSGAIVLEPKFKVIKASNNFFLGSWVIDEPKSLLRNYKKKVIDSEQPQIKLVIHWKYLLLSCALLFLFVAKNNDIVTDTSSRLQRFLKIGALKNLVNFTGKHLRWSVYLKKVTLTKIC